jgi:hypothetical protein
MGSIQLSVEWVLVAVSLGVKQLKHEADHWIPSSAMVDPMWPHLNTTTVFAGLI